ncbi:shewanella-like protein phosphatase 1, putative [Plasmodium gallinaceum]|uniref:Shewanella-like protein phosphatase 1, putative n=1 Tax=Plasmodium gallinaceum TaxID=5849 RepID=A0A1J1GV21_PLAGA|nr:shewanella-like protein phosphatase 1, putative [Plasmodium gallinaceum]CRG94889.1 shewanella-like protein phosphatase 1, putative [Plasmodium gallinaceum]
MIIDEKICILLLIYILIVKEINSSIYLKDNFLFKNLVINKKNLDSSYFYNYDNLKWDGKIVAIGDIHGDIEGLKLILKHSNLIDENDEWCGENVLLIQVGDILDRGIYGPLIYDYLFDLQKKAVIKNSKIILILGNHEQLNLCGYYNYVNEKETQLFFENNYNYRSFSFNNKNGNYFKKLIKLPSIVKVNNAIFTHAGISKKMSQFSINLINLKIRLQIENKCKILKYDNYNYLNHDSVLWYDDFSYKVRLNHHEGCSELFQILKKYNSSYLVVGHTKQVSHKIGSFCDNKYFLIDTGMSLFMNNGISHPSYLLIEQNKFKSIHLFIEYRNKKKCSREIHLHNPYNKKLCIYSKQIDF